MSKKNCPHCNGTGKVTDHAKLGARLQRKREKAGLTLREVGNAMGISIGYLSDLEHGRKPWTITKVEFCRRAIGLSA